MAVCGLVVVVVVGLVLYEVLVVAGWSADRVVDGVMGGSCAGCLCQVVR